MARVQALDVGATVHEGEQAGGCAGRDTERIGDLLCGQAKQLGDRDRRAKRTDRAGRMKAALAQVWRAGARKTDRALVTGDDRLDDLRTSRAALIADAERSRHHRAAAMRRPDAVAVVELDAVRRSAAEERRVEQIVPLGPARHGNLAAAAYASEHLLSVGRDVTRRTRDHHADGVEQVALRIVAHLLIEIGIAQAVCETDNGGGRACSWMERKGFGLCHAALACLPARISSSTGSR